MAYISKLIETAVAGQLETHMTMNDLHPALQSSYREYHSIETALLKVCNDILMNMNQQQVTLLVMLDLSAAFDTVNHEMLIKHLQSKIGLCGTPLEWFTSYLLDCSYRVTVNGKCSQRFHLNCGVPQGSCLGPMLFHIYEWYI